MLASDSPFAAAVILSCVPLAHRSRFCATGLLGTLDPNPFPASELALPPTHRFNVGLSLDHRRYLGSLTLNYSSKAFWSDVLNAPYFGYTDSYSMLNASFGVRWNSGKITTTIKATNLTNEDIQQHIFGDILKRSVAAEVLFKF